MKNIHTFYENIFKSLFELDQAAETVKEDSRNVADYFTVQIAMPGQMEQVESNTSPPTVQTGSELHEMQSLLISLKDSALETAEIVTANVFPVWQAELNILLNASEKIFGHDCKNMLECFSTSVDILRDIIRSVPVEVATDLLNELTLGGSQLQELAVLSNLTLNEAMEKFSAIRGVLNKTINNGYWCTAPPNITLYPPTNMSVLEGKNIVLECGAKTNFDFPIRYQWRKDSVVLPNATNRVLSINAAKLRDAGNYICDAFNHAGNDSSPGTLLTVLQIPWFFLQPVNITRIVGDYRPAKVICNATSTPNPQFRWYVKKQGDSDFHQMVGQAGNEYHIIEPQQSDEGWYRCEAWTEGGSNFSRPGYVAVVDYSYTTLSIPFKYEVSCNKTLQDILNIAKAKLHEIISEIPENNRPSALLFNVTVVSESKTALEFYLAEKKTDKSIPVEEAAVSITSCRRTLFNTVTSIKSRFLSVYGNMCQVKDVSEYRYSFNCPYGQQLDESSFILCSKLSKNIGFIYSIYPCRVDYAFVYRVHVHR